LFNELARVVLKRSLLSLGLEPGDVGVVVHNYAGGAAYEVEFLSLDGTTIGVASVEADDLRHVSGRAVVHEREILQSD
jgi:hypothetical protein